MNTVNLIGRLTKDPDVRTSASGVVVSKFSLAVDRYGKEKSVDFIPCTVFGKIAEFTEKYLHKGSKVGITGSLQSGSYEDKDKKKVYTLTVIIDRIEFAETKGLIEKAEITEPSQSVPAGFDKLGDDDIPF